jgi:hypothetical protein
VHTCEIVLLRELARLSDSAGWDVANLAGMVRRRAGDTDRMHSAYISRLLLGMERRGLVKRLDDEKPIAWQITDEGRKHV